MSRRRTTTGFTPAESQPLIVGDSLSMKDLSTLEMHTEEGTRGYLKDGEYYVDMDGKQLPVARVILTTFKPSRGNYKGRGTVCWKNGNKLDNSLNNLFWLPTGPGWPTTPGN